MSRTAARRALLTVVIAASCLTVTYAVLAASGPNATPPVPAADTPITAGAAYTASIKLTGPTTPFHNSAAARYNYAFGKESPFLPSNAMSANGQFLDPKSFPTAKYCGHCHQEAHTEWRQSAHANSFRTPWYTKNVNLLTAEKGVEFTRHCEGCHNPIALTSGALTKGSPINRKFDEDGITCSVCHSIQKVTPAALAATSWANPPSW